MRLPFLGKKKKTRVSPLDLAQQGKQRIKFTASAQENAQRLRRLAGINNYDFKQRQLVISTEPSVAAQLCFMETMVDSTLFGRQILQPLLQRERRIPLAELPGDSLCQKIGENLILSGKIKELEYEDEAVSALLYGGAILFLEGSRRALAIGMKMVPERPMLEPQTEAARRGPHQGFTECISSNVALLRMRMKTGTLRLDSFRIGRISKTDGAVIYLDGIANPALVGEVKERIQSLDVDLVEDNSILELLIQDHPMTIFPTTFFTERPDLVSSALGEGRVGILMENSPSCLIVPVNFFDFFKTAEDNYLRWPFTSFIRLARLAAGIVSLWAPAVYVAITTFHQEMLPTPLALNIAAARANVPFPAFVEVFIMELILELILESGVRLPAPEGQTIGIVGAIVLGEAAVTAQLVSPLLVIVVAVSSIASFVVPLFVVERGVRLLRFPIMILGASMGLYGIMAGMAAVVAVQCALTSFGQPYMIPVAPFDPEALKDLIVRMPPWKSDMRPKWLHTGNKRRQGQIVRDWSMDGENKDGEVDLSGE